MRITSENKLTLFVEAFLITIALSLTLGALQYAGNQRITALVIGVPTITLLVLLMIAEVTPALVRATRAFGVSEDDAPDVGDGDDQPNVGSMNTGTWQRVAIVYAWLVLYFIMTFVLGHYIATPIFMMLFFTRESGLSPKRAAAVTVGSAGMLYVLFEMVLDIPLWTGVLPRIVPDLIGGGHIPPLN